jgi:hypothetical protein
MWANTGGEVTCMASSRRLRSFPGEAVPAFIRLG